MNISIVLSTYNGEKYITDQIESLKAQSRVVDEVLIFDDCSTDGTVDIVEKFIEKHKLHNWHVNKNKENLGFRKNFMQGIKKSNGELIFLCDQDDIWMPNKIELMAKAMEDNDNIDVLASSYTSWYTDGTKTVTNLSGGASVEKIVCPDNILPVPPGCTYCVRKNFVDLIFPYWIESCPHDCVLWRSAEIIGSAYVIAEPLILWRKHSNSSWQVEIEKELADSELKWRRQEIKELKALIIFAQERGTSDELIDKLKKNIEWCVCREKFVETKNIFIGIKLLVYFKMYPSFRRYIKDWAIAFLR